MKAVATEAYAVSVLVDSWRCSNCGGQTYDDSKLEVPAYCCRCGAEFERHIYLIKETKSAVS